MVVGSDAEVVIEGRFYLLLEDVAFHLLLGCGLKHWQDILSEEVVGSAFTILFDDPLLRILSYLLGQFLEKRFRDLVEMMYLNNGTLNKLRFFFIEELPHDFRLGELTLNDLHVDNLMRDVWNAGGLAFGKHHLQ